MRVALVFVFGLLVARQASSELFHITSNLVSSFPAPNGFAVNVSASFCSSSSRGPQSVLTGSCSFTSYGVAIVSCLPPHLPNCSSTLYSTAQVACAAPVNDGTFLVLGDPFGRMQVSLLTDDGISSWQVPDGYLAFQTCEAVVSGATLIILGSIDPFTRGYSNLVFLNLATQTFSQSIWLPSNEHAQELFASGCWTAILHVYRGDTTSSLNLYNACTESWSANISLPYWKEEVLSHSGHLVGAFLRNSIFLAGYNGTGELLLSHFNLNNISSQGYDWSPPASFPSPCLSSALATVSESLVFAGGVYLNGTPCSSVLIINTTTLEYSLDTLSTSRVTMGVSTGGAVFAGGLESIGQFASPSSAVDIFLFPCSSDLDCDDGLFCNGEETCQLGFCLAGIPPCDPFSPCNHSCGESTHTCNTPKGFNCSRGQYCSQGSVCDGEGSCTTGQNPCTQECLSVCAGGSCSPSKKGTECNGIFGSCDGNGNCLTNGWVIVELVVPLFVIALLILAVAFFMRRRRERRRQAEIVVPALIQLSEVEVGQRLGGGNFGEVYKGTWQGNTQLALKKLKDPEQLRGFLAEAATLLSLNHPNIVRFLGVYISPLMDTQVDRYIAMEFLELGSVDQLLRRQTVPTLSCRDLLGIAAQAAFGMRYLEGKGIVHRDLALRNLLAAAGSGGSEGYRFLVKVSDFGLSQQLTVKTTKRGQRNSEEEESTVLTPLLTVVGGEEGADLPIPVRWSAPELLRNETATSRSDSWSYGMMMCELFTNAQPPFALLVHAGDVVEAILQGKRPLTACPPACPPEMYDLMCQCWSQNASERPDFKEISVVVRLLFGQASDSSLSSVSSPPSFSSLPSPSIQQNIYANNVSPAT